MEVIFKIQSISAPLVVVFFLKFLWLCWVFVVARGLSLVVASGGYSSLWCAGFSLRWLLLLWSTGSRCTDFSSFGLWALERSLSSCGARALGARAQSLRLVGSVAAVHGL